MGEQVAAGFLWGCSSVGRAPALQAGGHEFESHHLHGGNGENRFLVCTLKTAYENIYLNKTSEVVIVKVTY